MTSFKISIGAHEKSNELIHKDVTWEQVVKKYSTHKETSKKGGEYVIGGFFSGNIRGTEFMLGRSLLVIDIDKYAGSIDDLEFDLSMLPYKFVAYSSFRHTNDKPRVRIISELSRVVTPDEYRAIALAACKDMLVPFEAIDSCSWIPNQPMFAPQHKAGGDKWTMVQAGECFQVSDVIPVTSKNKAKDNDDLSMVLAAQPLDYTDEQVDATLAAYSPIGLSDDAWYRVGMGLYHQYEGSDVGLNKWIEWSKQEPERFNERVCRSRYRSFGGSLNPVKFASVTFDANNAGVVISTAKNWIAQIDECKDKHALEQLVMKRISADKSIGVVDLVDLEAAVKTKFSEFGVTLRADPLRKLFKPKQKRGLPDIGTNDLPLETMDNLSAVCDNNDVVVRYNVIKKDDEILIKDASWSIDNAKSASITWVRSACHKVEMKTTNIKNFITLLADGNQYNPVVEWVTSKPWDGVSRLNEFYATVRENDAECSPTMKKTLMLRWMVGAIAAAFTPTGSMVRGVLVFQGEQYTGKTRWIDALAPKELDLIKTGRSLVVHDKDSVKQILSCWISELGELDATFKKSDIAALKAFITSDMDELRRPYAAAESQYARRTVFAASVNEPKFLQDDTGNSRFWVLPITSIDHAHKLDMQQVWAEFYVLWNNGKGEQHFLSKDEMNMLNRHNEHFSAPDPIFEMIHSHLDWDNFDPKDCEWKQVSDVLRWIEKDNPTKYETILAGKAIQKLNLGHNKKSNGKRLVAVPKTRIFIKASDFNDRVLKAPTLDDDIPF